MTNQRDKALKLVEDDVEPAAAPETAAAARDRRRARIRSLTRPVPGTSDLLRVPFEVEHVGAGGRDVVFYDLTGMSPFHLSRRGR